MKNEFKNKTILVTGGAGSIGSALVREILKYEPEAVRILDIHEFSLHKLEKSLDDISSKKVRFLLGDVRDPGRLEKAMKNVDIVYHAAAYKHVPLCEYNPLEAIKTNVIGTQNVIDAAIYCNVKKVLFISTDKAVSPTGTLGASKLLGERIITAANYHKGDISCAFSSVRFGNVTMSTGSVIPIFIKQIKSGGPVTLTSASMTRFMMPIEEAVRLIFKATETMYGGEVFVLKMKAVKIKDLAWSLVQEYGALNGNGQRQKIKFEQIGNRAGEKLHEKLITREEAERVYETKDMLIVLPALEPYKASSHPLLAKAKQANPSYYVSNHNTLPKQKIRDFIRGNKVFNSEEI